MKPVWKNQLQMIWKQWFVFSGIFILLFLSTLLTGGALATNSNINKVVKPLIASNQYQLQIKLFSNFSSKGLKTITDYFFDGAYVDPTLQIRYQIERNEQVAVTSHQTEIASWNYNFQAWLMQQAVNTIAPHKQVAVDYRVTKISGFINQKPYQINAFNGFNDKQWSQPVSEGVLGHYNLKQQNLVIISQGRVAVNNNEVVVNTGVENQNNPDLAIGKAVKIANQTYQIVGHGFNYASYFHDDFYQTPNSQQINLWFTNSAMNQFWIQAAQDLNFANRRAAYYVNLPTNYITQLRKTLIDYYANIGEHGVLNTKQLKTADSKYQIVLGEVYLYTTIGLLLFMITLLITVIILKKIINQQKYSLGLLIAMGERPWQLALSLGLAFFSLLIIPIFSGFLASFGLQWYLTSLIKNIIFYPFQLVNWSLFATTISFLIFSMLLISTLVLFIFYLLKQKVILLLTNHQVLKHHRYRVENHYQKIKPKQLNTRLAMAFARSNQRKIIGSLLIYFFNLLLVVFLFFLINIYQHSLNYLQKSYTNYGNREFISQNTTLNNTFMAMAQKNSYDYSADKDYHWISSASFQTMIHEPNSRYHEITLTDFFESKDLKNGYLTPTTVAWISSKIAVLQSYDRNLYETFLAARQYWWKYQVYPYVTFGFKIYDAAHSMLLTRLPIYLTQSSNSGPTQAILTAYQNNQFLKWVYLKTANNQKAVFALDYQGNYFVNGIISAQLAMRYHLKINDLTFISLANEYTNQPWLKIPIQIVGINQYNYLTPQFIVNQAALFHYIFWQYHNVNETANIVISQLHNLTNCLLVQNPLAEINYNLSFINNDNNYRPNGTKYYQLQPSSTSYFNETYPPVVSYLAINSLMNGFSTLLLIITLIGFVVILMLFSLMLNENMREMLGLKFLGYPTSRIISWIMLPYWIGLVVLSLGIIAICYFGLQFLLQWIYLNTEILLFFVFSPWIIVGFGVSVLVISLVMVLLVYWQIKQGQISTLNEE